MRLEFRHTHDDQDGDTVTVDRHRGYAVPKGVMRRARAREWTAILVVEAAGVVPVVDWSCSR